MLSAKYRGILRKDSKMNGWGHIGLTCVGKLEALVSVRSIGVEFQPQVVGGAVQDQPHQLISREGPQWTWGAVFSIINLGRIHKSSYHLVLFLSVSVSHSLSLFFFFYRKSGRGFMKPCSWRKGWFLIIYLCREWDRKYMHTCTYININLHIYIV